MPLAHHASRAADRDVQKSAPLMESSMHPQKYGPDGRCQYISPAERADWRELTAKAHPFSRHTVRDLLDLLERTEAEAERLREQLKWATITLDAFVQADTEAERDAAYRRIIDRGERSPAAFRDARNPAPLRR